MSPQVAKAAFGGWEYQPYRIHARLAIDARGGYAEQWAAELPSYLRNRVDTSFAPLWKFDVELAAGAARSTVFREIDAPAPEKPADLPKDTDKVILLSIRSTPVGLELAAREYDAYVERWGAPVYRESQQASSLPEQLFTLLWHVFSPLAQVDPDLTDAKRATLRPRGSELPHSDGVPPWTKPGDVFLPLTRRTARGGQVVENGIQTVPWTYVETAQAKPKEVAKAKPADTNKDKDKNKDEKKADTENNSPAEKPQDEKTPAKEPVKEKEIAANKGLEFQVHSGSRRPFVARRSNRLELLAIGVRADAAPTTLQFHARKNEKKPLIGYETLVQKTPDVEPKRIGMSDTAGEVTVPPGSDRVQMLLIIHGFLILVMFSVLI
jgi:hypothetical protein